MSPLTRNEVESWPALGPMNLDKQRVLDLITAVECLQAAHHFLPLSLREAISRGDVDACRAYAKRTDEFMASLQQDAAELRAANAQLTAERDEARRQRDECAAALATIGHQMEAQQILDATAPATNDDARAILHAMASEPARPHVAVVVERASIALCLPFPLRIRLPDRHEIAVTTDEAAAVVTALLADGAVHERWLHGRGGR